MKKYDYLVVGSGLYGAIFAHEAKARGKSVLVVDKRPNIAGNIYTENIEGINVHVYGAHIFHTNNTKVWKYITQFAEFNRFTNSPVANYKGELYSLPFNMYTFNKTAAAAARTKDPVRQGLVSMTGTFIDTIVICTMTGLSIVIAGSWLDPKLEGVAITMDAFQKGLPFPGFIATFSLMLCLVFFAFTTILGWDYYGERCVEYLFNRNKAVVKGYRWLYILAVFIGPYMTVAAVWNIADIFNALMAFPNLIALLALSGVVVKETKEFHAKHKGSY